VTTDRTLGVCAFGLVVVRLVIPAHVPALVDAHAALAALALGLFVLPPARVWAAAWLVLCGVALSIVGGWNPWLSSLALPAVVGGISFFVLAAGAGERVRSALLIGVALGGALNGAAALYQRFAQWPDALRRLDALALAPSHVARLMEARPIGLSVSPDLCAGLCLAGLAACVALLSLLSEERRWSARLGLGVAAALGLAGIVVARSITTFVALGAFIGFFVLLRAVPFVARAPGPSARWRAFGGVGVLFAGAAAVGSLGLWLRGYGAASTSLAERVDNWAAAWRVFGGAPWTGVGLARFGPAYLLERAPGSNVTRYAHSAPVQALAELGIVGCAFLVAAVVVVAPALGGRHRGRSQPPVSAEPPSMARLAVAAGLGALLLRALVDYDLQIAQSAAAIAVLAGLLVRPQSEPIAAVASGRSARVHRRSAAALLVVTVPLAGVLAWRERALAAREADAEERTAAVAVLDGYRALAPFDVPAQLAKARLGLDALASCPPEACARVHAEVADAVGTALLARHAEGVAHLLRAELRIHDGDLEAALIDVDAALARDPGNLHAHALGIRLAQALGRDAAGREAEAAKWAPSPADPPG
jgi:hypothetical protein